MLPAQGTQAGLVVELARLLPAGYRVEVRTCDDVAVYRLGHLLAQQKEEIPIS